MEQVKELQKQICDLAFRSIHAEMAVARESMGHRYISTAVVFDNIRTDTTLLRRVLVSRISVKQKLVFLVSVIDEGAWSLFEFLSAAADDSEKESGTVAKHLVGLVHGLEILHATAEKISIALKQTCVPATKFSPELFAKMTSKVQDHLQHKDIEHAKAIRNYALLEEVKIFAVSMHQMIELLQLFSSSL